VSKLRNGQKRNNWITGNRRCDFAALAPTSEQMVNLRVHLNYLWVDS